MIVGRDTQNLDEKGIIKAAVETVAENSSDGVTAPLFYMTFGVPLGYLYKAVNTMDSMVGYKNERYINFGKIPAKIEIFLFYTVKIYGIAYDCILIYSWTGRKKRL